ncbi:ER-golgi trafficking TRAPP I complex 85 kDa subunit-domain-containing protein [Rhodofomes roseus]|uniref:ER-golgi trafficking TRAPP I complex 85 kDa subunit-domain-containing protein n=2 Tax=Rhodofomes roseus TaxID=34475 RepID=A0ABQ8KIE6_9APHY|nr:ER-golgi trafficking TRAPP I complex 85 kDa subunit-domain-containing protein [Rhodofomes roseus]KAH9837148.1 ER-golgi trafficking TRAPP I complex 85 kDa subunit-domain-containing protein [Rhodofomes roseus]
MPPTLPVSLSPHICVLASPDVHELFESSGLPPITQTLQSFVPLPNVTTRTTSLTSVVHSTFALRFSDLVDTENSAHEDEDRRAARTMDWISARVSNRAADWVRVMEAQASGDGSAGGKEGIWKEKTPWWEELRRCVEGDCVPNSDEGWNHPAAIILTVSTRAVNPLQALQDLNTRPVDFPPWVEPTALRYYLIIHPANSELTDPIAEALFNAVKKQYGLHSYLLPLVLPADPLPAPVPVPALLPRLPPPPPPSSAFDTPPLAPAPTPAGLVAPNTPRGLMSPMPRSPGPSVLAPGHRDTSSQGLSQTSPTGYALRLSEADIQQTGKFVREFVVMSLIPWMEKYVIDWNENFSSSRRLPSRLFSSTRRLFGSAAPSPAVTTPSTPVHGPNPSISSVSSRFRTHQTNSSITSITSVSSAGTLVDGTVTQQRRLAEFATMLGDYKLATSIWEALRKEGRGGSDVLPLLLAPSPALSLHAAHALAVLRSPSNPHFQSPGHAQLRALSYAVRWVTGIDRRDFLGPVLEGERWLVQAAGSAEEPPSMILYAHAAFLSERKNARRRSALWYLLAADHLEKAGTKSLAMFLFRRAHDLYKSQAPKELSPSFWESEARDPADWTGFPSVLPGIEHELGRLLYTTGDTEGAVRFFLGLLRGASDPSASLSDEDRAVGKAAVEDQFTTDKVYLEDFRVAAKHFKATEPEKWKSASLQLPVSFCQPKQTKVRFPGNNFEGDPKEWTRREEDWAEFWASRGKEKLERSSKAAVDEYFWVDLGMRNPLDVEVNLSGLSIVVREASSLDASSMPDFVEVEVVDGVTLGPREYRTIPVAVRCGRPASLQITHVVFEFLSLLPVTESLALRGRRLHDTTQQRQNKAYASDILIEVDVEDAGQRLRASFVDDRHLILIEGEYKRLKLWMTNSGSRPINEAWMVSGREDELWIDSDEAVAEETPAASSSQGPLTETLDSSNSLRRREPYGLPLGDSQGSSDLAPGESMQVTLTLHASQVGERDLGLLFIFREVSCAPFWCVRVTRPYEVIPVFRLAASAEPSRSVDHSYGLSLEVENLSETGNLRLTQVTTISPLWASQSDVRAHCSDIVQPQQITKIHLGIDPWEESDGVQATLQFVSSKLQAVLHGVQPDDSDPPPLRLACKHISKQGTGARSLAIPLMAHFIHCGQRTYSTHRAQMAHRYIPYDSHPRIFPLFNPYSIDVVLFWELDGEGRSGHILVPGLTLGASHAYLDSMIDEAESAKVKRSMYAETQRERSDIIRAIRESEWNAEMDPTVVTTCVKGTVRHDFSDGPCSVSVKYILKNLSPTHSSRVTLRLAAVPPDTETTALLSPRYAGRLTHRREIEPYGTAVIYSKVWATRPGSFRLDEWVAETQVTTSGRTHTRHLRYVQGPPLEHRVCFSVVDDSRS